MIANRRSLWVASLLAFGLALGGAARRRFRHLLERLVSLRSEALSAGRPDRDFPVVRT